MNYLICGSLQEAQALSSALFQLSRPSPEHSDVTQHYFQTLEHPTTSEVALAFDPNAIIPKPLSVDSTTLGDAAASFFSSEAERQALRDYLAGVTSFTLADILPASIQSSAKPHTEMETEGWFTTV